MRQFRKENGDIFTIYTCKEANIRKKSHLMSAIQGTLTNDKDMEKSDIMELLNKDFPYLHLTEEII